MMQQRAAAAYAKLETSVPPEVLSTSLDSARQYNSVRVTGPILDAWLNDIDEDNPKYKYYLDQLSTADVMGRVIIPAAKSDLPIYHGTTNEVLQKGVGHLYGSDLPVGGPSTHAVLTGHTGLPNATLFDNLVNVAEGDEIFVQVAGLKMKYVVYDIEVVLPHETESLTKHANRDLLTLITCTPYGINTHRLLVHAERAELTEDDQGNFEDRGVHVQWWMWLMAAIALGSILLSVYWRTRGRK